MVTEEMRKAGTQVASDIFDALVSFRVDGLGDSKKWEEFKSCHSGKNMDLIKQYANGEIDSVTAIYIAMHRESVTPYTKIECQGKCKEHRGTVKRVEVRDIRKGKDWGLFSYCDEAIDEGIRRGLDISILDYVPNLNIS